jgi:hypothetical protein
VVAPAPTAGEDAPRTLRRSIRNAGRADEHTLLKAERLTKKKNLEDISFSNFSDSRIISNLGRLAINTNISGVTRLKNLEVDRLVACANKNNNVNANDLLSDDEREERLQEALNHAGGLLNESLIDAENDHILDLSPVSRKKKFNKAKTKNWQSSQEAKNPFKDYYKMKGVFWNSRGLADLAKHKFLAELVREEQINFIALSETGRESFPDHVLKNLCARRDFLWHAMAPHGRSGGILLGVDLSVFDIGAIDEGDFYVKFTLRYKSTDFKFVLYSIYGLAQ